MAMRLITCCPSCQTRFRVVADQLKISHGWVRCGQCEEVFDAQAFLEERDQPVDQNINDDGVNGDGVNGEVNESLDRGIEFDLEFPPADLPELASEPAPEFEPVEPQVVEPEVVERLEAAQAPEPKPEPELEPVTTPVSKPVSKPALHEEPPNEPVLMSDPLPSFVRRPKPPSRWSQQPWLQFANGMMVVLMPLVLVVQILVHERNSLAVNVPILRPWLEGVCRLVDCDVHAPQDIAALVISGSSFAAQGVGGSPSENQNQNQESKYRLTISIHNQASTAVAVPALELSLLDDKEQVLVRRVITLQSSTAPSELNARAEWSTSLDIAMQVLPQPIASYRMLLFYP